MRVATDKGLVSSHHRAHGGPDCPSAPRDDAVPGSVRQDECLLPPALAERPPAATLPNFFGQVVALGLLSEVLLLLSLAPRSALVGKALASPVDLAHGPILRASDGRGFGPGGIAEADRCATLAKSGNGSGFPTISTGGTSSSTLRTDGYPRPLRPLTRGPFVPCDRRRGEARCFVGPQGREPDGSWMGTSPQRDRA